MTARWDALPKTAKRAKTRRKARTGRWWCMKCGDLIEGTWASAERHADAHGGARLEAVVEHRCAGCGGKTMSLTEHRSEEDARVWCPACCSGGCDLEAEHG